MQRFHHSRGEKGLSSRGGYPRRRSASDSLQRQQPAAALWDSAMIPSSSCVSSGHYMTPYSDSTSTPQLPPPPLPTTTSSRSSPHAMKHSYLPRRNTYSKGINVKDLQPPPPRGRSSLSEVAVASRRNSAPCPSTPEKRSVEDAALSRVRELCMDIIQSAREGTSPPQRAEIKEVVADYHRSRNQAISPRDPNFAEIPSEFSEVLTYGLARSQTGVKVREPRSKFSEIKHELRVDIPTIVLGPNEEDEVSCVSLPSIVDRSHRDS